MNIQDVNAEKKSDKNNRKHVLSTTKSNAVSLARADMTTKHSYHFLKWDEASTGTYPIENSHGQAVTRANKLQLSRQVRAIFQAFATIMLFWTIKVRARTNTG